MTAVATDPPYVIGAVSAGSLSSKSGGWADMMNSAHWFTAWYTECARVLKHRGSLWTSCNWRTIPVVMRAASDTRLPVAATLFTAAAMPLFASAYREACALAS